LRDTRTPLRFAIVRVLLTTALGYVSALPLPRLLGIGPRWGVAGLTISAGIASWVEFTLLQRGIRARIGQVGVPPKLLLQVWIAALIAAAPARGVLQILPMRGPIPVAIVVLGLYGAIFFAASMALKLPEAQAMQTLLSRRLGSTPKK
jgi:putative peptidoglycan lipid II flippase